MSLDIFMDVAIHPKKSILVFAACSGSRKFRKIIKKKINKYRLDSYKTELTNLYFVLDWIKSVRNKEIIIYTDNQGLARNFATYKGFPIHIINIIEETKRRNKKVCLLWINRRFNEAHKLIKID